MKFHRIKIAILLIGLSGLSGCGKDHAQALPADAKKIVQVYVDLLEVQEKIPATHPAYLDSCHQILARYDLSESDYKQVIAKLNQKPEQWESFYSQVLLEIDRRKTQYSATAK